MLSLLSSGLATSARKRQPGPASSARKGQPACHCDRTIGGILDVCSQDNDGSACWRTCCQACFAARDPLPHRYHNNVYHQAELVYAMVEAEIIQAGGLSESAFRGDTYHGKVQTIYWRLPLLNWSRAVLRTLLPRVRLVTTDAPPPTGCKGFGAAPAPGAYWRYKSTAKSMRQEAWLMCGIGGKGGKALRRAERLPREALLMPRAGAGLQSSGWRNFAQQAELVGALRAELRGWGGAVRVVPTPGGEVPFCEQLRLWAGADLIVTPNGAHFVNAIFMREGATLIEGVPWLGLGLGLANPKSNPSPNPNPNPNPNQVCRGQCVRTRAR